MLSHSFGCSVCRNGAAEEGQAAAAGGGGGTLEGCNIAEYLLPLIYIRLDCVTENGDHYCFCLPLSLPQPLTRQSAVGEVSTNWLQCHLHPSSYRQHVRRLVANLKLA